MFKILTIHLLVVAGCLISIESTHAFGGRRRAAQTYVSPAPPAQTISPSSVTVTSQGTGVATTPQYQGQQHYQAPQYQAPATNYYYPSSRQTQDASYAYPKTDMRRYNFQYNHN